MMPKSTSQREVVLLRGGNATKGLAPDLPALVADLVPSASMHLHRTISKLTSEGDDLSNDKLRNTPGIAEW